MNVCARCGHDTSDPRALYCPFDGTPLGPHAQPIGDPLVGTLLDERYLLLARIGEGGMATVYLARHLVLPRLVAIKLMHPQFEGTHRRLFRREAAAIARVASPHVAAVIEFGTASALDRHYLAMEFVPGVALDKRLEQLGQLAAPGTLPPERVLHIAAQMAYGLAAAHACGVLHRDVKPSNVLLTRVGPDPDHVKLIDFGIARALNPEGDPALPVLTPLNVASGTPEYMAPEQSQGDHLDERSDVYALGVTLFEMLTGTLPFVANTPDQYSYLHLSCEPPTPSSRMQRWAIPASLDAIVMRCLQKEPASRYASMGDLLADLGTVWRDVAPPAELTPVVSYAGTLAAPARGEALDLTRYQQREPDELLDAPAIAEELGRLEAMKTVRLDALLAAAWAAGLPAEVLGVRNTAALEERLLAAAAATLAKARESLHQHDDEARRREADLRGLLVDASAARDDTSGARDAPRQLREIERRLALRVERDEREKRRLESSLSDGTREVVELAEALEPTHGSLFDAAQRVASDRPALRPLVVSLGESVGAIARCLAVLRRVEG